MEIENTKEATVIELKNNRVFIGVYLVPLFTLIGLIINRINYFKDNNLFYSNVFNYFHFFKYWKLYSYKKYRKYRNFDLKQCKPHNKKIKEK